MANPPEDPSFNGNCADPLPQPSPTRYKRVREYQQIVTPKPLGA